MAHIFYLILTGFGIVYILIAAFSDIDFLIGKFSLGIPYAFIGWGIIGLLNTEEPYAFLVGFLVPFISIGAIYTYTTSTGKLMEDLLFKKAIVSIPIKPDKKGEIKFKRSNGYDFYIAAAENITKPIPKNTEVRIIDIDGVVAYISTDLRDIKKLTRRSEFYHKMFRFIQFLAPRPRISGTCMICFGGLIKSKQGIQCPYCKQIAHKDHMKKWLSIKEKCPHCRTHLTWVGKKLIISKN